MSEDSSFIHGHLQRLCVKGVVLAGGTGSRLRPLTYTMPKQMIPVGGVPVLEHAITDLRDAGVTEIGVVLGEHWHDEIKEYFGDGSEFDVDLTYIYQGEPLGLGHAVGCTEQFVGDNPFVLFLGDDLIQGDLSELVERFDPSVYAGATAVKSVADPSRYGVVELDESDDVVGTVEKPDDPPTDLAAVGVFVLTPEIFDEIATLSPSWRGELELSDAIDGLLTGETRFQRHVVDGWWYDVGTPEDVIAANRVLLDELSGEATGEWDGTVRGRVATEPEVVIEEGATVRGPVWIGRGAEVRAGATVGPYTTVCADSTIAGGTVQSSVVLQGAFVRTGGRVLDSIVGREARLDLESSSETTSAIVGTDSEVSL